MLFGHPSPMRLGARPPVKRTQPRPTPAAAPERACSTTAATSKGIRPSKAGRRRTWVLLAVHVLLAAHIAHWFVAGTTISPLEPSEAMEFSKEGVINAGFVFFVLAILATALFGRFFCGWGCHLIALQDGSSWILKKLGIRPKPLRSRALLIVPAIAFLYMFVWPLVARWWMGYEPHGGVQLTKSDFWGTFPPWPVALATFLVCGFVIIYFLGSKGFCTYACPYGAIFGAVDRVSPGRIRVTDACEGCGHCTAVCTSNVSVHAEVRDYGMVIDAGCMKCMDCVSVCPKDALYFGFGAPSMFAKPRVDRPAHARGPLWVREKMRRWSDLSVGEELLIAAAFVAGLGAFRGLFWLVPFLMALGLSAILAWLVLMLKRTLSGRDVRIGKSALRQGGALTTSGRVFVGAMVLVLGVWVSAGIVRWHEWRADTVVASLEQPDRTPTPEDGPSAIAALANARLVDSWAPGPVAPQAWRAASAARVAWLARWLGDGDAFETEVRRALELAPARLELRLALVDHLQRSGRGDEVEAVFEEGLARLPDNVGLRFNYGVVLASRGRAEDAVLQFERAVELDPTALHALENLAGALCQLGRFADGLARFEQAIEISPEDAETRLLAARAALEIRELDRALVHAREATRLAPDAPITWVTLAHAVRLGGDEAEAARLEAKARALGGR